VIIGFVLLSNGLLALAQKGGDNNFHVSFANCKEYVAFGPIALEKARAALPLGYSASIINGNGGLVLRTSSCDNVSVDDEPQRPAIIAHYGINIESVDGSGDINNYSLVYVTDYPSLAVKFRRMGLPVLYSSEIAAEEPATIPGAVYISIFGTGLIPYSINGIVNDPQGPEIPFVANWWYEGKFGAIKQSTNFSLISFGAANLVLQTTSASELGQLIGGNSDSNFPWYNVRGIFSNAIMDVTLK